MMQNGPYDLYDMAKEHQREIREFAIRSHVEPHPRRPIASLAERIGRLYSALMALLA